MTCVQGLTSEKTGGNKKATFCGVFLIPQRHNAFVTLIELFGIPYSNSRYLTNYISNIETKIYIFCGTPFNNNLLNIQNKEFCNDMIHKIYCFQNNLSFIVELCTASAMIVVMSRPHWLILCSGGVFVLSSHIYNFPT